MARTISLSDEAFLVLRSEKQAHESDSDVVLRLHRVAHRRARDPARFFADPPAPDGDQEAWLKDVMRMRDADRDR